MATASGPHRRSAPATSAGRSGFAARLNIVHKFIIFLVVLGVLPLLILGFVSYRVSQATVEQLAHRLSTELLRSGRDYLDLQLYQVESMIANISGADDIITGLNQTDANSSAYSRLATQARIGYILNSYLHVEGLVAIDILAVNGNDYHVGDTLNVAAPPPEQRRHILEAVQASDRLVHWLGVIDNLNENSLHPRVISAAKTIWRFDRESMSQQNLGVLLVNISVDHIYDYFIRANLGEGGFLMVIGRDGRIIFHPDHAQIGQAVAPDLLQAVDTAAPWVSQTIDGKPMIISSVRSARTGWAVAALIPLTAVVAQAELIRTATLIAMACCLLLVSAAAWFYSRSVVTPIKRVTEGFKRYQMQSGDWSQRLPVKGGDEIAELSRWFNTFVEMVDHRQESEAALRASEERYALAIHGATDAIWDWDLRRGEIHLSPRWRAMLGLDEAEMRCAPGEWLDRIHPEDRDRVLAEIAAHLEGRTAHLETEHRLLRAHRTPGPPAGVAERVGHQAHLGTRVLEPSGRPVRGDGLLQGDQLRRRVAEQLLQPSGHDLLMAPAPRDVERHDGEIVRGRHGRPLEALRRHVAH